MAFRPRLILVAVSLGLAFAAGAAQAQYSRSAQQVIARARTAAGGAGWNYLRGWHETGHLDGVAYEAWLDPLRFGMRMEVHEPAGLRLHGFNGFGDWRITPAGAVTGVDDPAIVAEARTEAFLAVQGWYYPGRFDATGKLVGARKAAGKTFDVIEVLPWRGRARELWFDRKTGLLARIVARSGSKAVATELSDYRKVGPVQVAFRSVTDGGVVRQVDKLDFTRADRAIFSLPPAAP